MWGNGFYKLKSLGAGAPVVREVNPIRQSSFAMEIRVLGKHTLGNKNEPRGVEEKDRC